jgi:iron complex transport system ATP-binding protein
MIQAKNIHFSIGKKTILQNISLSIKPGSFTAAVGSNGAGKSTLLRIISGELQSNMGEMTINGTPIQAIKTIDLAKIRAVLNQKVSLSLPFRANEVVMLGRQPHQVSNQENLKIVDEVMKLTNTFHLRNRVYHTLSGGEQQRVQMARVLAQLHDSKSLNTFLLLDEPTSSLDVSCQHLIFQIAKDLAKTGMGVFAIVHDLNLAAQYADEIILLKDGKIFSKGSPNQVLTEQILTEVFNYPIQVISLLEEERPIIISRATTFNKNLNHINSL